MKRSLLLLPLSEPRNQVEIILVGDACGSARFRSDSFRRFLTFMVEFSVILCLSV